MTTTQSEQFEECKKSIEVAGRAIVTAQTTHSVLTKQMEALKVKRKKLEENCLKEHGVSVKELQKTVDEKLEEYIKLTAEINSKYEEINDEQNNG
jgi:hypothetical protein